MPVNPRGNGYEAAVYHKSLPGGRLRKLFPTKVQAEAWELRTKADLKAGKIIGEGEAKSNSQGTGKRTLSNLLIDTTRVFWAKSKSRHTSVTNAESCLDLLGADTLVTDINSERIQDMVFVFQQRGLSGGTINRKLSALSKMLHHAYDLEWINRLPKIKRKKENENRKRYLSDEEEEQAIEFFEFIGKEDMKDLFIVGLDTGMRLGEIRKLAVKDVDFKKGIVTPKDTKNGKDRDIPMTDRVRDILAKRGASLENKTDKYWQGWTNSMISHYWNHMRSHLGLMRDAQFVPHAMRHTFCSRLIQRDVSLPIVSKLAGHSSIQVTMGYAHVNTKNLTEAIQVLQKQVA